MRRTLPVALGGAALVGAVAVALIATHDHEPRAPRTAAAPPQVTVNGQRSGATVSAPVTVAVTGDGITSAKLVLDGAYLGEDTTPPYEWVVAAAPGDHKVRARTVVAGVEGRVDGAFTVGTGTPPPPAATPTPATTPTPAPPLPVPTGGPTRVVHTTDELRAALATARPGDVIDLADGTYTWRSRFTASASGTAAQPITLRGTRDAVIASTGTSGNYSLWITGDYWRVEGVTISHATKGIVLDGSVGTVITGVLVEDIGQEGVHFRSGSADGALLGSTIRDTGKQSPQYGEGAYVGSATSNWHTTYTDPLTGQPVPYGAGGGPDRSDRVRIEGNTITDTPAEGVDVKEGTTGGMIRGNRFVNDGYSGQNSADSWVDVKGTGWLVEGNTGRGTLLDAFQTHVITPGSGAGNTFVGNTVEGGVRGYVVGIYPRPGAHGNVVTCDNRGEGVTAVSTVPCTP